MDLVETPNRTTRHKYSLFLAALAAFCAYFCMYAFRKPFTAATFAGETGLGLDLKSGLVLSQLLGYTLSKFIGIKVVSEMHGKHRALAILGLVGFSEAALVGFALVPVPFKLLMIFLNGLPLGMVFGLILGYLEGRKQTEALSAALCASFILSSGFVKFVGSWLLSVGVSEFAMPMVTGLFFIIPLIASVCLLQLTPPPDAEDQELRSVRQSMKSEDRRNVLRRFWPGLTLLICVYVALTIVRTIRDDFGVEIWRDMGVSNTPSVFATSEMIVGIAVTGFCALTIWVQNNFLAIRLTIWLMCASFVLVFVSGQLQQRGLISPYLFMVACGVGLYFPYVAFHTTVFERLIAIARMPSNLGFLMYLADSIGYLGYAAIIVFRSQLLDKVQLLPFFRWSLLWAAVVSVTCLVAAMLYFQKKLRTPDVAPQGVGGPSLEDTAEPVA